jgi:hypothetical protein
MTGDDLIDLLAEVLGLDDATVNAFVEKLCRDRQLAASDAPAAVEQAAKLLLAIAASSRIADATAALKACANLRPVETQETYLRDADGVSEQAMVRFHPDAIDLPGYRALASMTLLEAVAHFIEIFGTADMAIELDIRRSIDAPGGKITVSVADVNGDPMTIAFLYGDEPAGGLWTTAHIGPGAIASLNRVCAVPAVATAPEWYAGVAGTA